MLGVNGGKPPDPPPTETPPGESSDMDISSPIGNNSIYNNKRAVSIVEQVNKKIIAERLQETQQKTETWFKPHVYYKFAGYNCIRNDRDDGKGGVAILIKTQMKYREISFRNSENIAAVGISAEILPNKKTIYLVSLYVKPQTRINPRVWSEFFDDIPKPCLIAGDFNAHHVAWGNEFDDTYGNIFLKQLKNVTWYLSITDLELSPQVKGTLRLISLYAHLI
ncbi:hypothetical protein JTB14_027394 [Gonioctena quinquepunctata]|nr:hypothetical protein JTB14_027394 [Gonioctena quinquepunctata]